MAGGRAIGRLPSLTSDVHGTKRSANGEDQLAPEVATFADTVSFGGVCEIVSRDRRRRDRAGVQQRHNSIQGRAVAADSRAQYGRVRSRLTKSVRRWCDPNQPSAWLQDTVRARLNVTPDRIEHHIAVGNDLGEILSVVVDHAVGPECADIVEALVVVTTGTEVFRQLDREPATPPAPPWIIVSPARSCAVSSIAQMAVIPVNAIAAACR